MVEEPTDKEKSKEEQSQEKIASLEKRIAELEKAAKKEEKEAHGEGIVANVVGQFIPGLGGIIKALEESSPEFKQRIADTDAEIKHRIDVGWSSKPVVDYHISTRPLRRGPGKIAPRAESVRMPASGPEREPIVDVLEGKDGITVIAELPGVSEEDLKISLEKDILKIDAGRFSKKVVLPYPAKGIQEKGYKERHTSAKAQLGESWLMAIRLDEENLKEGRLANRYLSRIHRQVDKLIIDGKRSWHAPDFIAGVSKPAAGYGKDTHSDSILSRRLGKMICNLFSPGQGIARAFFDWLMA